MRQTLDLKQVTIRKISLDNENIQKIKQTGITELTNTILIFSTKYTNFIAECKQQKRYQWKIPRLN